MGAAATQCANSHGLRKNEELLCAASKGCDAVANDVVDAMQAAKCDGKLPLDECLPARMQGLDDQSCADVLLVQAATRGDLLDVKSALMKGARIDTSAELLLNMGEAAAARPDGMTPLMRASKLGHEDVVNYLLQAKANLHRCDSYRWTAICHAAAAAELGVVRVLLECGSTERQKVTANRFRAAIIDQCEDDVGADSAAAVRKEFEPSGLLASEAKRV